MCKVMKQVKGSRENNGLYTIITGLTREQAEVLAGTLNDLEVQLSCEYDADIEVVYIVKEDK